MVEKWDPEKDTRVIAVKAWAERYGNEDWIEGLSDMDIAMSIQFTHTDEGAIKKFCRELGVDNPVDSLSVGPRAREEKDFVLPESVGWDRKPCPTCHMVPSAAGVCECTAEQPTTDLEAYDRAYERGWRAAKNGSDETALRADARNEVDAWYDGYHDRMAGCPKWDAKKAS